MTHLSTEERFDYSHEEWIAIENIVAEGCRPGSLSNLEHRSLLEAGNEYRRSVRTNPWLKARGQEKSASWEDVKILTERLLTALHRADATSVYRPRLRSELKRLRDHAERFSRFSYQINSPQAQYYRDILSVWVDHFGGQLKMSRDKKTGQPKGPLLRFFVAVTQPVMGDAAPKPETIYSIVRREKER